MITKGSSCIWTTPSLNGITPILDIIGINSLRLGGLHINCIMSKRYDLHLMKINFPLKYFSLKNNSKYKQLLSVCHHNCILLKVLLNYTPIASVTCKNSTFVVI